MSGAAPQAAPGGEAPEVPAEAPPEPPPAAKPAGQTSDAYTRSSPSVRKLADELGVDLSTVTGTGRRGRITDDDVRAAAGGGDELAGVEGIPLSPTRETIARRLTEAKQAMAKQCISTDRTFRERTSPP